MQRRIARAEVACAVSVRVFLLDDHEIVRRGVRELLEVEDDLEVVGEAGTAEEALARIPATAPDVAIIDMRLPDGNGVEVCREVRSRNPEVQCVDAHFVRRRRSAVRLDHGRRRGLPAQADQGHRSRRRRSGGSRPASRCSIPNVTARVLERLRNGPEEDERLARLTEQERKILDLIAEGLTNRQIGERMFLAEKTVKNYVSNLLAKLGMERRTEAAVFAARLPKPDRPEAPPGS